MSEYLTTRTLGTLFTGEELERAARLVVGNRYPHALLLEQVVTAEVMARIDKQTGQENSRDYFAYLLEHAVLERIAIVDAEEGD